MKNFFLFLFFFLPISTQSFFKLNNQYEYIRHHYGSQPIRLFFIWTSGLLGYGKKKVRLGGTFQEDFLKYVKEVLSHVPNIHIEILLDEPTLYGSLSCLMDLHKTHQNRFKLSSMRHHLLNIETEGLSHVLQRNMADVSRWHILSEALDNALHGNPALSSDIARIWWLRDPLFPLNIYMDIDTFVENAKKNLLFHLFPKKPHQTKIIRMDNKEDLQSNDVLASYRLNASDFDLLRKSFIDHQLQPVDYQIVWKSYLDKWKALEKDENGFTDYQDSISRLIETLKKDFVSQAHRMTVMNKEKVRGLTLPVALLRVTGTAADKGCSLFERELYQGEKPSTQSWGSFAWTPCDVLASDDRLAHLASYLLDWDMFSASKQKGFLKKLANEIDKLNRQICISHTPDKPQKCGIELAHNPANDLDMDAYRHFKKAMDSVHIFLKNETDPFL